MMQTRLALVLCLAAIAGSRDAYAHHSFAAEFDASKPVTLTGAVTKVEWANPHTWFFVDVKNADGSVTNWGFELAGPAQLLRLGWRRDSMKVGDLVTVEASRARDGSNQANAKNVVLTTSGQRLLSGSAPTQ
jgi:hypothetical protein